MGTRKDESEHEYGRTRRVGPATGFGAIDRPSGAVSAAMPLRAAADRGRWLRQRRNVTRVGRGGQSVSAAGWLSEEVFAVERRQLGQIAQNLDDGLRREPQVAGQRKRVGVVEATAEGGEDLDMEDRKLMHGAAASRAEQPRLGRAERSWAWGDTFRGREKGPTEGPGLKGSGGDAASPGWRVSWGAKRRSVTLSYL